MDSGISTGFSKKARRVRARKNKVLKAVAMLHESYFWVVARLVARWQRALENSIGLAFDMFDPHPKLKFRSV